MCYQGSNTWQINATFEGKRMKSLLFGLLVIASTITTAFSAELICGSVKAEHKRTYPINEAAIKLASQLGVKTCTGTSSTRFKDAMKKNNDTGKFIVVDTAELIEAKAKLAQLGGGSAGPSWN